MPCEIGHDGSISFQRRVDLYDRSCRFHVSSSSYTTHCLIRLNSPISYSTKITPLRPVTSLSCLVFMIDHIMSDQSWQFSLEFNEDYTYTISHIIFLSGLSRGLYLVESIMTIQFLFNVERTCMIGHVIVLIYLCHRPHTIWSVLIVQYHIM